MSKEFSGSADHSNGPEKREIDIEQVRELNRRMNDLSESKTLESGLTKEYIDLSQKFAALSNEVAKLSKRQAERDAEGVQESGEASEVPRVMDLQIFRAQVEKFKDDREKLYGVFDELERALEDTLAVEVPPELRDACNELLAAIKMAREAFDSVDPSHPANGPQSVNVSYLFLSVNSATASAEGAMEDVVEAQDDQDSKSKLKKLWVTISRWFRKITSNLWCIFSGLATPKEWTLKGAFSGELVGVGPKAEVEIKFGR